MIEMLKQVIAKAEQDDLDYWAKREMEGKKSSPVENFLWFFYGAIIGWFVTWVLI